ncbi:hypothetical protein E8E14_006946 [Neopestalotiopsis sp. 37M]|nr:hypothetical protein E8E14_006946 [Neopestalotiopsis sp. 37M]
MKLLFHSLLALYTISHVAANLLPFERIQLSDVDVEGFPDIGFASLNTLTDDYQNVTSCREYPGSAAWPSSEDWSSFNESLGGALLHPLPPGAACYAGPSYDEQKCKFLLSNATYTRFFSDDPVTVMAEWPTGSTCLPTLQPTGNCTQGGLATYVVNATTIKHVQAAVNFARNRNLRLVIKNTGHDFGGRSTGAGALSVWTHNLKEFQYTEDYSIGHYDGPVAQYAAGTESWELGNRMAELNVTIVAPGGSTVGAGGGWLNGGGHTTITSTVGLGSDQVLSLNVVTADGRFVTADPYTNEDLFFALRGGAGSTFGIVTSALVKVHPRMTVAISSLDFAFEPNAPPTNGSFGNFTLPGYYVKDLETFWKGTSLYYLFTKKTVEAGGIGFSYIYPLGDGSFSFTGTSTFPDKTPEEIYRFMQPLYDNLRDTGLTVKNVKPAMSSPYGTRSTGVGAVPNNKRYTSRLFPRTHWDDPELFQQSMAAVRVAVEAGYTFHGTLNGPSLEIAGWPGRDSAVNPAWRKAVLHAMLFYKDFLGVQTAQEARDSEIDINRYMDTWRELTPGSGAYINEADPAEPEWQQSFFGDNYPRLLEIKRNRDPWGVFWALTTVGSEDWEVKTADDYPHSENGKLCREVRLVFKQFETVSHCRSLDMLKLLAHFGFPFQEHGAPLMINIFDSEELVDFYLDQDVDIHTIELDLQYSGIRWPVRIGWRQNNHSSLFLNQAAQFGDLKMFEHLISRGADVSRSDPLHHAARHKSQDVDTLTSIMEHFINKYNLDINACDKTGGLPLRFRADRPQWKGRSGQPVSWAAYCYNPAALEALINLGADPAPALYVSVSHMRLDCLEVLLESGYDASKAFALAVSRDEPEAAILALEYGATAEQALRRRPTLRGTGGPNPGFNPAVSDRMLEILNAAQNYKDKWRKTCDR